MQCIGRDRRGERESVRERGAESEKEKREKRERD